MSETVHYRGKAILQASGSDVEPKAQHFLLLRGENEKPNYYDTWVEFLTQEFYKEFFYYEPKKELYMINYEELDPNELIQAYKNVDGSIDFHLLYHNGGAGFEECLEEAMDKLK